MNHPNPDELIEFHCAESAPEHAAEIARHLEACAACRSQVEVWRDVRRQLGSWHLPEQAGASVASSGVSRAWVSLRWAAAAAILVAAGYGVARWTAPAPGAASAEVRAAVAQELREELRAELQQFSADQAKRQTQYQQALVRTLGELEVRRLADYAGLRRDVETLAVRAEDELLSTREGLARLAASTPPRSRAAE